MPIKIARCFAFVGPHLPLDTHFAIGNFINNVLKNEDIIIKGDGSTIRSYMYASDLTIWLWIILQKGKLNYPYNIGSNESINIAELAKEIKNFASLNLRINVNKVARVTEIDKYVPDINRAKKLGLEIKVNLLDSIIKTIKFYKK